MYSFNPLFIRYIQIINIIRLNIEKLTVELNNGGPVAVIANTSNPNMCKSEESKQILNNILFCRRVFLIYFFNIDIYY